MIPDIIGYIAALLGTIAYLPQVVKIIKTKDTKSISLSMYFVLLTSIILWEIYCILTNGIPLLASNTCVGIFVLIIIFYKIKYK